MNTLSEALEEPEAGQVESGLGAGEVAGMLLRHIWLILGCGVAGLLAAGTAFLVSDPAYESQAKLLVRYLLERGGIDSEMKSQVQGLSHTESVINDEIEILTSWNLAQSVAQAVGGGRLIQDPKRRDDELEAAHSIRRGLKVTPVRESNVIQVSYRHADPAITADVLTELVDRYFDMHLEIHRSTAAHQFLREQTGDARLRLAKFDEELNQLRAEGGILSVGDGLESLEDRRSAVRGELLMAQAERAGQLARIQTLEAVLAGRGSGVASLDGETAIPAGEVPGETEVMTYSLLVERLVQLRKRSVDLLSKFTEGNPLVRINQSEIENLEAQRRSLAVRYPSLIARTGLETGAPLINLDDERAKLAQIEGKISILQSSWEEIEAREKTLPEILGRILDLERHKQGEEERYRYFKTALDNARIDGSLDPSLMPNISVVQAASPPERTPSSLLKKIMFVLAAGGFGIGAAFALLLELVIDRRIKSPEELEKRFQAPLMLTVPLLGSSPRRDDGAGGNSNPEEAWRPFAAAIQCRLFYEFRSRGVIGPPKLLACTSLGDGAGVSTMARRLAAVGSEGGSRVLLVNLASNWKGDSTGNSEVGGGVNQRFTCFNDGRMEEITGNFGKAFDWATQFSAHRSLTPRIMEEFLLEVRSGAFDMVIFDLPAMCPASPALLVSGFMDHTLLVLDPDTADRDRLKRSLDELNRVGATVACIFNKMGEHPADSRIGRAAMLRRENSNSRWAPLLRIPRFARR